MEGKSRGKGRGTRPTPKTRKERVGLKRNGPKGSAHEGGGISPSKKPRERSFLGKETRKERVECRRKKSGLLFREAFRKGVK